MIIGADGIYKGSDLDGDLYFVGWDDSLFFKRNDPPGDYKPPPAFQSQSKDVTRNDVIDFFVDFMENNHLGEIANQHVLRSCLLSPDLHAATDDQNCLEKSCR